VTPKVPVTVVVNGQKYERQVEPNSLLVDFLRYEVGLTGTKEGCSVGVCGACTVLVDGRMVSSCLALTVVADGTEVTTIEGVASGDQLSNIQEAFIRCGGFQCGICTPGQVLAAAALLRENPHPDEAEIREWMKGNLCRCTGYYGILRSIKEVAGTAAGEEGKVGDARL
jgi:carbon-monoxide dehydrogenase small subunit